MKALRRVFGYVWPQWPRIIVVVVSAMVVSILLSVTFMTLIPLLKVMTGEEGLHGWLDRKTCSFKYGVDLYVPSAEDFFVKGPNEISCYLLVTRVHRDGLADAAGLKKNDRIVGIPRISEQTEGVSFAAILEELALTDKETITLHIKHPVNNTTFQDVTLRLNTPANKAYIERLDWSPLKHTQLQLKMAAAKYAKQIVSLLPREQDQANKTKAVVLVILAVAVFTVIRCIAKFYQDYLAQKVVQVAINRLREDAFVHLMDMPIGFFANERPSDSVSRLVRDTGTMGNGIKVLLGKGLREPLNALCLLAGAALLNWQLTLIFLCGAPLTLGLVVVLGRKMKRASRKSLMAWSQMLSKLQETMAGLRVIKVYNQQKYEHSLFKQINKRLLRQLLRISKVDAATSPIMEVLGMAAGSAALIVGASWVTNNKMDGTTFLVLLGLLGAAAEAVRKTSDIWNKIQEANAGAERVFRIMDEPVETEEPRAFELEPLRHKIEFRDVIFSYPGTKTPVLKGINLSIQAGHNVAIVGPNGSGKTTLANLIPRFYDPDNGQILIDGKSIHDATLLSLRSQIGMVTQNITTFNDTIAANIAYGKPEATKEEIIAAAKRAFAHEFIEPLPNGYDTIIGEQGVGLSGGQLQRIVIARAILKNPAILIFDEATSQVDADSEAKIHRAIEEIMHDRTTFLIAHRFSTVVAADVIIVMNDGQIIAQGRHENLMQTCPLYQNLYKTQLIKA